MTSNSDPIYGTAFSVAALILPLRRSEGPKTGSYPYHAGKSVVPLVQLPGGFRAAGFFEG